MEREWELRHAKELVDGTIALRLDGDASAGRPRMIFDRPAARQIWTELSDPAAESQEDICGIGPIGLFLAPPQSVLVIEAERKSRISVTLIAGRRADARMETSLRLICIVRIKRKVRNYVEMVKGGKAPHAIYVTEGAILDDKHADAYKALDVDPKKGANDKADDLTAWMCKHYYDVRMVGALMVGDLPCGKVRGPLQLGIAQSVEPIRPVQLSITSMAATKAAEDKENKTMGNKWIVPYAVYRVHGYINAPLAKRTGATDVDLELLWESLREMWHYDKSAARPEMSARRLVAIKHAGPMRTANTPELDDLVTVERATDAASPARAWSDYRVMINEGNLPSGVQVLDLMAGANPKRPTKRG